MRNLILVAFLRWIRREERRPGREIARLGTRAMPMSWLQETKQIDPLDRLVWGWGW